MENVTTSAQNGRKRSGSSRRERGRGANVSITDVANHADVSVATVSRVMNRHESVDPLLRRKVCLSSRSLGFTPKRALQCLAIVTGRHSPAMPAGYVSILTSLVSRFAAAKGVLVELVDIDNLELCYEAHIDAVVGIVFDDRLSELRSVPNLPLVAINHPMADQGIASICADHYQQGFLATRHLTDRGHRDIGFLAIQPDEWGSSERLRGYGDALADAGIELDPSRVQYSLKTPVYEILTRWKSRGVTGILNFSEDTALETLHILANVLDLQCGKDISTISLEDIPVYQYWNPPQTTVSQPLEQLARLAVDTALDLAGGQPLPGKTVVQHCLSTQIIERDSVANLTDPAASAP